MQHALGWILFHIIIMIMLVLDLGVLNKKAHRIQIQEAVFYSVVWILIAFLFNTGVYYLYGEKEALEFLTGYIIEKSLSVDNIFVMILIFKAFQIPDKFQHKVLFWGILGAIVFRAIMIFFGVALVNRFHWLFYFLGIILIYSSIKMVLRKEKETNIKENPIVKWIERIYPTTIDNERGRFFVKGKNKIFLTNLFICLLVIEFTDIIFALDSIPAILAITLDPFIVYTSNIFAILGLRSLYFALAGIMEIFRYLKYALFVILFFIGIKMILVDLVKIPTLLSLIFILGVLSISVFFSIAIPK
ncbi:MAG: TerC family protein [Leptonema sp. (in: bacteria)]